MHATPKELSKDFSKVIALLVDSLYDHKKFIFINDAKARKDTRIKGKCTTSYPKVFYICKYKAKLKGLETLVDETYSLD